MTPKSKLNILGHCLHNVYKDAIKIASDILPHLTIL